MHHRDTLLGYAFLIWSLSVVSLLGPDIYRSAQANVNGLLANVVGMSASVAPNEWNSLAQEFTRKAEELDQRSQALDVREQALLSELDSRQRSRESRLYSYLFALTGVLLVLVCMNYYLDYLRVRRVG